MMLPGQPAHPQMQPQTYAPQPTPWQQPPPAKTRGVSGAMAAKFALPSPESLGVSAYLHVPAPAAAPPQVDWNQIQDRMERLGVLKYEKDRLPGGVRVVLLLPTSDPKLGQPVSAQAETEAAAVVMALDAAEAWARKR
ncbi:MAG: hypothetical protein HY289_09750 [Planctomycetes bacterium]|nr:hypothetical protein [Planctomycetota bacterium]